MRKHNAAAGDEVTLIENLPTADQYLHLRAQNHWRPVSTAEVETAMANSLFSLLAVHQNRIVGCARIVGDGGLYFYVQDLIVDEDYRGKNIGTRMLQALLEWLAKNAGSNAFVGLMAADGTEGFYSRFGFERRPGNRPGMSISIASLQEGRNISPSM
ncbi:MAG: GNAT family N-acetyltransferase [Gammaproteobacteria bacterium]|nr:GNAT family N-acetyltransferase [Gammaproteobacteria bacterium]